VPRWLRTAFMSRIPSSFHGAIKSDGQNVEGALYRALIEDAYATSYVD
jgi:hypothetical protein